MKYEHQHIKLLVQKFWDNEIANAEMDELRSFLQHDKFRIDFPELAAYLDSTRDYQSIEIPSDLEKSILKQTTQSNTKSIKPFLWFSGVAASLAFIIWGLPGTADQEYTDEEVRAAYMETKNALFLVSNKMESGNNYAMKLGAFNNSQQKIKSKTQ